MWVFPLAAGLIAVAFAASLGRRFVRVRQPFLGVWCIALAMYAAASFAVAAGAAVGWSRSLLEVYWTLGAVLNVPLLAAGELLLLWRGAFRAGSIGRAALWVVLMFVVAFTIAVTRGAAIDAAALGDRLPSGKEVLGDGTVAHRLPQLISIPSYLVLVVGAIWSVWRMRGRADLRDRSAGTLLIAAGATITAAAGSAFAALGNLPAFSVSLLAGVAVMYAGFLRATRAPSRGASAPAPS
jgi:hypothetical protein